MPPERWSGLRLTQFLERHGRLYPHREYIHPSTLSRIGEVKVGKFAFSYSIAEHDEFFANQRVKEMIEKTEKNNK